MSSDAGKTSNFFVPRRLAKDDRLRTLSGDALRLYLWLCHKLYRCHKDECLFLDWELTRNIGIPKDQVANIRTELAIACLITFKAGKNRALYTLLRDAVRTPKAETVHGTDDIEDVPAAI